MGLHARAYTYLTDTSRVGHLRLFGSEPYYFDNSHTLFIVEDSACCRATFSKIEDTIKESIHTFHTSTFHNDWLLLLLSRCIFRD